MKELIYAATKAAEMIGVVMGTNHAITRATFTRPSKVAEFARSIMKWGIEYGNTIETECIKNTAPKIYSGLMLNSPDNRRANSM